MSKKGVGTSPGGSAFLLPLLLYLASGSLTLPVCQDDTLPFLSFPYDIPYTVLVTQAISGFLISLFLLGLDLRIISLYPLAECSYRYDMALDMRMGGCYDLKGLIRLMTWRPRLVSQCAMRLFAFCLLLGLLLDMGGLGRLWMGLWANHGKRGYFVKLKHALFLCLVDVFGITNGC
ncbi:uncharacterized protein B0H64DRAFT_393463 [Chaetomium fimeti]|uniref:Uncharacterized protein n=1 Tax=Chaetomium fimeti TaxID=1854472 RepID=A0AAE0HJY2_9PEZI|nr:hypothetical protein B0H64DRAFT_393463 [Chaetomium fimeti]